MSEEKLSWLPKVSLSNSTLVLKEVEFKTNTKCNGMQRIMRTAKPLRNIEESKVNASSNRRSRSSRAFLR
jgi:hypothetical protein